MVEKSWLCPFGLMPVRTVHQQFMEEIAFGKLKEADSLILDRDGWGGASPNYL